MENKARQTGFTKDKTIPENTWSKGAPTNMGPQRKEQTMYKMIKCIR